MLNQSFMKATCPRCGTSLGIHGTPSSFKDTCPNCKSLLKVGILNDDIHIRVIKTSKKGEEIMRDSLFREMGPSREFLIDTTQS